MGFLWYSRFLSHHPYIVLILIFVLSSISLIVPLSVKRFPDFSDPQLGFEARGTILSQRLIAWRNLIDSASSKKYFIDNPLEFYYYLQEINLKVLAQMMPLFFVKYGNVTNVKNL
ncbi:PREDICTED: protein dispatched-like [Ceratosolen solmsi marchali]|uniref:Protein dispatched-like n=1 Tax=Ceratosolen solmsi marchali TaxID=326594 RepID=A0AAJ7DT81_9HYME|nr:PREDICTED: protein dispatched-like [Ceratosolen solmsi marchali]